MKKINLLIIFLGLMFFMPACTEDDHSLETELKEIESYLKSKNLFDRAQRAPEGMYYIIEQEGEGTAHPTENSLVYVIYEGRVMGKTENFDSSNGNELALNLSNTIYGWRVGVPKLKKNGKGKLFIPSALAYGLAAQPGIPSGSVLEFDITLVNFAQ